MKKSFIFICLSILFGTSFFTSCSEDELGPTIFTTQETALDRSQYTFPLDTFLEANFREPYNLRYLYRMEDIGADMNYNLVPCTYQKSKEIIVLTKYLWLDVYAKLKSPEFLKKLSPKIFHLIGSPAFNPSSGTMTLGEAAGGKKITFYRGNQVDVNDIESLNEMFFKTMHHEFSHILHQNKIYPTEFRTKSQGQYDGFSWQEREDSVVLSMGFITPYAGSAVQEDWVETIANYIVKDSITWNNMLNTASREWEVTMVDKDKYNPEIEYKLKKHLEDVQGNIVQYEVLRRMVKVDKDGVPVKDDNGNYIDIDYKDHDKIDGKALLLEKLDMCRKWMKENFGLDLDALRAEVQSRQYLTDSEGKFVLRGGKFVNRLTEPTITDPSITVMDSLLYEIDRFKELQNQ